MLLALERPAEALVELEATMKKEPNRFRSTYLAARAAALAGDDARAKSYYRRVTLIAVKGDTPGRAALEEARQKQK